MNQESLTDSYFLRTNLIGNISHLTVFGNGCYPEDDLSGIGVFDISWKDIMANPLITTEGIFSPGIAG